MSSLTNRLSKLEKEVAILKGDNVQLQSQRVHIVGSRHAVSHTDQPDQSPKPGPKKPMYAGGTD